MRDCTITSAGVTVYPLNVTFYPPSVTVYALNDGPGVRSLTSFQVAAAPDGVSLELTVAPRAPIKGWEREHKDEEKPSTMLVRLVGRDLAEKGISFIRGPGDKVAWLRAGRIYRRHAPARL